MKSFDSVLAARSRVAILLGVLLAIGGCDGPRTGGDAGDQTDSGNPHADGGTADSGTGMDAGDDAGSSDAGTLDGGGTDGSTGTDGGGADAAADGGVVADAGSDGGTCTGEVTWFECTNGMDDDCDGTTDTDPGCSVCVPAAAAEAGDESTDALCADGFDNDCNGYVDCEDFGCRGLAGCATENTDALCMDGIDNDADGRIDCLQRSCAATAACRPATMGTEDDATLCGDGLDNDYDGLSDCDDHDSCDGLGFCATDETDALCSDGHDNDGDGFVDCLDNMCAGVEACNGEDTDAACTNGTDDDGDGRIDCRDLDCLALAVCHDAELACDDGTDDDLDGNADCHDADCASACAATACSDTNWFGSCTSPSTCAAGMCARPLSSYSFPGDQPLLITEIMPNPKIITDANGEYFEVTNVSADVINIEGVGIVDGVATHEMTVTGVHLVMPNEHVLFVHNTDSAENGGLEDGIGFTFDLNNGSDDVAIRFGGEDIHRVSYAGTGNDLLNTGTSAAEAQSFNLDPTSMTWCLTPNDDSVPPYEATGPNYGTPGTDNVSCTP